MPKGNFTKTVDGPALKKPKLATNGNCKPDQAWMDEVTDELHPPDESQRPPAFLYDIRYQWEGIQEDLEDDFFLWFRRGNADGRSACTSRSYVRDERGGYIIDAEWRPLKRPCLKFATRGTNVCDHHGANVPRVKALAEQRIAEASEVVALRLIGLTGTKDEDQNPVEHSNRIKAANSVLDRAGIRGMTQVEITTPGYKKVLGAMFADDSEDDE